MAETKQAGHQWTLADEPAREPRLSIFINYRRDDSGDAASRLYEDLTEDPELQAHFEVFWDVTKIAPARKYQDVIAEKVASCDVVLVLIGRQWLTITDEAGRQRLEQEDDLLRREIEAALKRGRRVIPILVQGVKMHAREKLPPSLADLADWQAHEMRYSSWKNDLSKLVEGLDTVHVEKAGGVYAKEDPKELDRRRLEAAKRARRARRQRQRARLRALLTGRWAVAAVVVVVIAAAALVFWPEGGDWSNVGDDVTPIERPASMNAVASVPNASLPFLAGGQAEGDAALWTSEDGQSWTRSEAELASAAGGETHVKLIVAPRKRNVIAIGQELSAAGQTDVAVWRSQDGRAEEWERVADGDLGGSGRQVALSARRVVTATESFLLVGGYEGFQRGGQAALWRASATAESWERVLDDSFAEGEAASINRILCFPADEECQLIVAFGWSAEGGNEDATVWTSDTGDAGAWTRHRIPAEGNQRITDAVPFEDRLVAVGVDEPVAGEEDAAVWISADASTWARVSGLERSGVQRVDVVVAPSVEDGEASELIAAGLHAESATTDSDAALWTSSDGEEWSLEGPAEAFGGPDDQRIESIVARRAPMIAVGADGDVPGVWCRGC